MFIGDDVRKNVKILKDAHLIQDIILIDHYLRVDNMRYFTPMKYREF